MLFLINSWELHSSDIFLLRSNMGTREKHLQEVEIIDLKNSDIGEKCNSHCGGDGHI